MLLFEQIAGDPLSEFGKPAGWEEGDFMPLLQITRMTAVSQTVASGAFKDKVKDLAIIKDIKKW